jgi:hypothetical protein
MKGFERYQRAILEAMAAAIKPLIENPLESKAAGEALWNHLFDLPGPRQAGGQRTPSELFVGQMFKGFAEISRSLETLEDIRALIGHPPERRPRISEERYLQFLAEAYLNEVYLLRERIRKYVKKIQRAYRIEPRSSEIRAKTAQLIAAADFVLDPILQRRNLHTHEERFSDDGISRLVTAKLLTLSDDPKFVRVMRSHYDIQSRKVKTRWRKLIKSNNAAILLLIGDFFDGLHSLVFDKNSQLLFPAKFPPKT